MPVSGTFMSAFNDLDGIPASANPFTLTQVLRGEWNFDGFVVSDYKSVEELIRHGLAEDGAMAAQLALNAGVDMEMVSRLYNQHGEQLIKDGKVTQATLDEAVRRILRIKFRLGLFEHPYADEARESIIFSREHLAAAREVAVRSMVLLKNENDLLPLSKKARSIAVIGPLADILGTARLLVRRWQEGRRGNPACGRQGCRLSCNPNRSCEGLRSGGKLQRRY